MGILTLCISSSFDFTLQANERSRREMYSDATIIQRNLFPTKQFHESDWSRISPWRLRSIARCPPTPAAWECWRATRCVPRPTWVFRWWHSTLAHRKGYFQQHLNRPGDQSEEVQPWNPADFCTEEAARITVSVEDRDGDGARVAL